MLPSILIADMPIECILAMPSPSAKVFENSVFLLTSLSWEKVKKVQLANITGIIEIKVRICS